MVCLLNACGRSKTSVPLDATPGSLKLVTVTHLGLAYANSSINTSVFRQQSILGLGGGQHAVSYFDALGDARIDVLSADNTHIRSVRVDYRLERRLLTDGHCSINLGLSSDGRVHFIYGAHGTQPIYGSITLTALLDVNSSAVIRGTPWLRTITYPQFYRIGVDLQLWFRSDPDNTIQFVRCNPADSLFSSKPIVLLAANGSEGPYMNQLAQLGDRLALSWLYRVPSADGNVRNEGLYIAISDDAGVTWKTRDGASLALPIDRSKLTPEIDLMGSFQPLNQTSSCFAPDGCLYVSFYARDSVGLYQVHVARFGAVSAPVVEVVSDNVERYDLAGAGTLSLPLSRPQVVASNTHVYAIYRQSGALVVASRDRTLVAGSWMHRRYQVGELGVWEPTYCRETWEATQRLHVFVQSVRQGPRDTQDKGNPTAAKILTFLPNVTNHRPVERLPRSETQLPF